VGATAIVRAIAKAIVKAAAATPVIAFRTFLMSETVPNSLPVPVPKPAFTGSYTHSRPARVENVHDR
jgi:hypothetical protein